MLKSKTRLLITHQVHLFRNVKGIPITFYSLEKGRLVQVDSLSKKNDESSGNENANFDFEFKISEVRREALFRSTTEAIQSANKKKLIENEKNETGLMKLAVLIEYFSKIGKFRVVVLLSALFLMQVSKNSLDLWLSKWLDDISAHSDNNFFGFFVFCLIVALNSLFTLVRSFSFADSGLIAAKLTFSELLETVSEAPISFFERNPIGRMLTRFSYDAYSIDVQFPFMANIFISHLFALCGSLILILITQWQLNIIIIPLFLSYGEVLKKFRICSQELKRLDAETTSPVFSKFSETMNGVINNCIVSSFFIFFLGRNNQSLFSRGAIYI
jgi:ABC-type bacteriocin/lantibiotic exporter with double-glycine peptidase domain